MKTGAIHLRTECCALLLQGRGEVLALLGEGELVRLQLGHRGLVLLHPALPVPHLQCTLAKARFYKKMTCFLLHHTRILLPGRFYCTSALPASLPARSPLSCCWSSPSCRLCRYMYSVLA